MGFRDAAMAEPIDELVQRWKKNPSPAATIALCEALRGSPRAPLVQQVGDFATQKHAGDVGVQVAVARMYIDAHRLGDAQAVLVAVGKQAPRESSIYRWLGEVLLRRGDADRAEKVIERAIQLGSRDPEVRIWLDRARVFRPMQAKAGARAVAAEVAHAAAPRPQAPTQAEALPAAGLPPPAPAAPLPPRSPKGRTTAPMFGPSLPAPMLEPQPAPVVFEPRSAPVQTPSPRLAPPLPAPSPSTSGELEISVQQPLPTAPPIPKRRGPPFEAFGPQPSNGAAAPAPLRRAPSYRAPADSPMVPHPRDVLDALSLAGVFEPPTDRGAAATAAWAAALQGPKRKGSVTLVVAMVLFLGASVGVYFFYQHKRALEHVQAEALLDTVEAQLQAGKPGDLPDTERELGQAFLLDSRNPRAALDWTRERALVGLVKSGADVAFEDAMARAKEVGVPEEKYAFARVASFLLQGDTAGAAAVLTRWDGPAANDPWYQMLAGATLERAGDARARDRYATAAKLDPKLVVAQVAQARATATDGDAQEGMQQARSLRKTLPDRAEPVALIALAWGRDPNRESVPAPPEVDEIGKRADELPLGLRFVPHAVAALHALDKHSADDARTEITKGLAVAESPGAAVWLGTIALPLGDEGLPRKAALGALQLSAVYEPARALAARVALLGDRLDEALKATEDLEPTSPEVAVVRAACAYERVDADGVVRALEALPPEARKLPFLAALDMAPDALSGKLQLDPAKVTTMAADDAPWSDLLAMDTALGAGDLASADKIATAWSKDAETGPLRALRLARLARYESRLDAADTLSLTTLNHGTVTPRVLWERVYTLVAKGRAAEVPPLLSHYPLVLGPLATWLSAYAAASAGNVEGAKGKTASVDPPPATAPLEARVVAAAAFGAMKDKRRGADYVRDVLSSRSQNPDLVAAALALGYHKVEHGRRPPTYE